jgi:hypothetical protein
LTTISNYIRHTQSKSSMDVNNELGRKRFVTFQRATPTILRKTTTDLNEDG